MKNLNFDELKVKSFVTSLEEKQIATVKGGMTGSGPGSGTFYPTECNGYCDPTFENRTMPEGGCIVRTDRCGI